MINKIAETLISWGVTDNVMTLACAILGAVEEAIPKEMKPTGEYDMQAGGWNACIDEIRQALGPDK